MANNQHSFAKRQREIEKKRKADEKRARKQNKGQVTNATDDDPASAQAAETNDTSITTADE
jgi:hypothetical protein